MIIAQAFPVGEHLEEELEAHGWSQAEFAEIIQRPTQFVCLQLFLQVLTNREGLGNAHGVFSSQRTSVSVVVHDFDDDRRPPGRLCPEADDQPVLLVQAQ